MHEDRTVVEGRIARELRQWIRPAVRARTAPLEVTASHLPGEPVPFAEALAGDFEAFPVGGAWGRPWGTTWFHLTGRVPDDWRGPVDLVVDLGFSSLLAGFQSEGLVRRPDGSLLTGIHPRRRAVALDEAAGGSTVDLYVEAAANPTVVIGFSPTPMGRWETAGEAPIYRLAAAHLAERDETAYGLALDLEVLDELMRTLTTTDPRRARLLSTIEAALDRLDLTDVTGTAADARAILAPALALPARASAHRVIALGHAHIDTAWLWPLRETVRKCIRTFASAVDLMDRFPDYRFVCSQAAQYQWIAEHEPALFGRIGDKVAAGQWVPVGGMWVEADMNLPSGESLVRQLVHGQRAFETWFGRRCDEVWIPDVFGYPASLPQLFALAGCRRFVTQKLSWNKQNRFPHHTFWWEGIDGTRVLAHFPPVETYNAMVRPKELDHVVTTFRDHGWSSWSILPFGHGDGGGGPTREMLERAHRLADLDGSPRVRLGSPGDFFTAVEAEIAAAEEAGRPSAPVFRGELYLEMHRGTLTSQLRTKLGNRRVERLLRDAELWWSYAGVEGADAAVLADLDGWWKDLLVQQFHDILPGSSIGWVHDDAETTFERLAGAVETSVARALDRLAPNGGVVANARTHAAHEVVIGHGPHPLGPGPVQLLPGERWAACVRAPGLGLGHLVATSVHGEVVASADGLSNGILDVRLDEHGQLASVWHRRERRELLRAGSRGAVLELAPDHPVEYDAWDLEAWTRRLARPLVGGEVAIVAGGPLVGEVSVTHRVGASTIVLTYRLRAGSGRLDIEVDADWREREQLLSLAFPLDVLTDRAACGIQFGYVERPTHPSTSWDAARFEVCAHRWVDLSEPSFGVAVLDDGRYGHALFDGAVRVTLLRGARYPDPDADVGRHRCTIALLPHGPGRHDVLREAEALDLPLRIVPGDAPHDVVDPLVSVDHPGVLVTAVKPADDGSGDVIVRLHEAHGDRASVVLRGSFAAAHAAALSEEPERALEVGPAGIALELRPFEIATVRARPTA